MDKETKLKEATNKAGRAKQLLDNQELKAAFETVESRYLEALLGTDVDDDVARFRFAEAIKVVRLVARQLEITIQNGKLSQAELDAMNGVMKAIH